MEDTLSQLSRRILSDRALLSRVLSLPTLAAQAEEAARLGHEMGLSVDPAQAREFLARTQSRELSDAELSRVAGGKGGSDDTISGGEANETIDGGGGDDTIDGGAGNDNIDGGGDEDSIDGGGRERHPRRRKRRGLPGRRGRKRHRMGRQRR